MVFFSHMPHTAYLQLGNPKVLRPNTPKFVDLGKLARSCMISYLIFIP